MKTMIIFLLMILPNITIAKDLIMEFLYIEDRVNHQHSILLCLVNNGLEDIQINKRFALGPESGPNELSLQIRDLNGKDFPYSAKNRLGMANDEDFTLLKPHAVIGQKFSLKQLAQYYALPNGKYVVKAFYQNKNVQIENAFNDQLTAKEIMLTIAF